MKKNDPMKKWNPTTVSLEQLKQQELDLTMADISETETDFSDLAAEDELDFNAVQEREYEPEVWEVENEDDQSEDAT